LRISHNEHHDTYSSLCTAKGFLWPGHVATSKAYRGMAWKPLKNATLRAEKEMKE
jgi:hypothetical protein